MAGCGAQNAQLRALAGSVLGSTGLVDASTAETMMAAGEKVYKAASPLSSEQEYYLGRAVAASLLVQYPYQSRESWQRYVNRVGGVLARSSDRPELFKGYTFIVVDTDEINAMAAPSGFVFISRGFLKQLSDEDELAAVLAHEIGHVVLGHGVAAISQANLTEAVTLVGREVAAQQGGAATQAVVGLFGESVGEVVETLTSKGYSRRQEYAADQYAVELLSRVGYDPGALDRVLLKLEKLERGGDGGWLTTHPAADDRREELEEVLASAARPETSKVAVRGSRFKKEIG